MKTRLPLVVASLAAALGCGDARIIEGGRRACTSWEEEVGPLVARRCVSCHGGAAPAGGYDLTRYAGALTDGNSRTVAAAGDAKSLLLTTLDPAAATDPHQGFGEVYATLRTWVVDCDLSYLRSAIHPGGLMNPDDPDFHGRTIEKLGWSFATCQKCHGADFSGGAAGVSCLGCHAQGPTSCTTCHGQPPASGAHLAHATPFEGAAGSGIARAFDCGECHLKPMLYTDVGHLFAADGSVMPPPAALQFGALAGTSYASAPRLGVPTWDHAEGTCSYVYCHGDAFADGRGTNHRPSWTGGIPEATCGTCHGLPPSDHKSGACSYCHPRVADAEGFIVDVGRHVDGKVSLGDESGTCTACHGQGTNPAPPRDLAGRTSTNDPGVGAHAAHLGARHKLRGPIPCTDCHSVPDRIDSPGHIDSEGPAEVFPAGTATLAAAGGARPSWDHATSRCSDVYCHGGGATFADDAAPTVNRTPGWILGTAEATCGACHGVPPVDAEHVQSMTLGTCASCHGRTIDASGHILVSGPPGQETSTHIDGVVDGN